MNCIKSHLNISSLRPLLGNIQNRSAGFFESYNDENLMELESLREYTREIEQNEELTQDFTDDPKTIGLTLLNSSSRNANNVHNKEVLAAYKHIFDKFGDENECEDILELPEITQLKTLVFQEFFEDLLHQNLSEFLDGEKPVNESSLKEYYQGLFGPTRRKKENSEIMSTNTNEYFSFKKLLRR
jgi:hypothetical protein